MSVWHSLLQKSSCKGEQVGIYIGYQYFVAYLKSFVMPHHAWSWILLSYWLFFPFHDVSPHASPSNRKRTKRKQGKLICNIIFHTLRPQRSWIKRNLFCPKCIWHQSLSGFQKTWCNAKQLQNINSSSFPIYNLFSNNKNHTVRKYIIKKKKTEFAYILHYHHTNTTKCLCQHRKFCGRDSQRVRKNNL